MLRFGTPILFKGVVQTTVFKSTVYLLHYFRFCSVDKAHVTFANDRNVYVRGFTGDVFGGVHSYFLTNKSFIHCKEIPTVITY